jgi:hypothetical protein
MKPKHEQNKPFYQIHDHTPQQPEDEGSRRKRWRKW